MPNEDMDKEKTDDKQDEPAHTEDDKPKFPPLERRRDYEIVPGKLPSA
jgi:hypothetical protein